MTGLIQRAIRQQRGFRNLEEEVFIGLQLVADRLMEPWARHLRRQAGLTPAQYNVLRILRGAGADGVWAGEIAERLITRSPDVTRLVDRLERQGLVRRSSDPADRRAVRVHVTAAGLERIAPLDPDTGHVLGGALSRLTPERLTQLRDGLEAVLERLDGTASPGQDVV